MAEIKSTLDIIMERTKNLTMTDEEKASFRRKEAEGKVKGWIQKYQDGAIDLDTLKSDVEKETAECPEVTAILKSQLLDSIKLNGENGRALKILQDVLDVNTKDIEDMVQSVKRELEILRINRIATMREDLKKNKIYGSAVVPNPDGSEGWQEDMLKAESDFRNKLKSVST